MKDKWTQTTALNKIKAVIKYLNIQTYIFIINRFVLGFLYLWKNVFKSILIEKLAVSMQADLDLYSCMQVFVWIEYLKPWTPSSLAVVWEV